MCKYNAKQIKPGTEQSPLYVNGFYALDFSIIGENRTKLVGVIDYIYRSLYVNIYWPKEYEQVRDNLEEFHDNFSEKLKSITTDDYKKLAEFLCDVACKVDNEKYDILPISGKGKTAYIIYRESQPLSEYDVYYYTNMYFNLGSEWFICEGPLNEWDGHYYYCFSKNDYSKIRTEISDFMNCSPDDIVLYGYEGEKEIYKTVQRTVLIRKRVRRREKRTVPYYKRIE